MVNSKFCPSCHLRNEIDARYCMYCGASLEPAIRAFYTTEQVSVEAQDMDFRPCDDYLKDLPAGALALFVLQQPEPILVIQDTPEVILGRTSEEPIDALFDLSDYQAQAFGVSRRHARITYASGVYLLEDLSSTNGTWVNNKRLWPNEFHKLQNNDNINLGHLTLTVCLHSEEP